MSKKADETKDAPAAAPGEYPTWRYHKDQPPVLVETAEQDKALGKGWADSPAAFLKD